MGGEGTAGGVCQASGMGEMVRWVISGLEVSGGGEKVVVIVKV
jgi:hypothetical protein